MKAIAISLALLVPLAALAADEKYGNEKKAETNTEKKTDEKVGAQTEMSQSQVLDRLHRVSLNRVELGNLAQTHAKSEKVKHFGEKMAKDFTDIDQQVIDYAKGHDIVLSEATASKEGKQAKEEKMTSLGKLQGEEFDKKFLSATIESGHRITSQLEAAKGKYEDAKFDRVLGKAIDTLKQYQRDAEKLQKDYAPAS
jgi:predicted outer membrane protein